MSGTPMKLILTQEVSGLGAPGDVVEVAGGYGRNYLVPRGLAMRWTRGAEKQIDLIKRARSVRDIRGLDDAREAASALGSLTVRLETRAGSGGRLFGSISPADIAAAVRSTSAGSRSRTRSRPSARTRWRSGCIPRSGRPWTSRSRRTEPRWPVDIRAGHSRPVSAGGSSQTAGQVSLGEAAAGLSSRPVLPAGRVTGRFPGRSR